MILLLYKHTRPMVTNVVKTIALDRAFMQGSLDRLVCCYFYCSAGQPCQQWEEGERKKKTWPVYKGRLACRCTVEHRVWFSGPVMLPRKPVSLVWFWAAGMRMFTARDLGGPSQQVDEARGKSQPTVDPSHLWPTTALSWSSFQRCLMAALKLL